MQYTGAQMPEPLKIAIAGIGRMGVVHALHAYELTRDSANCSLAALADEDLERARRFAASHNLNIPCFASVESQTKATWSEVSPHQLATVVLLAVAP